MVIIKQKCSKSDDYWVNITLNLVQKLKREKIKIKKNLFKSSRNFYDEVI